MAKSAAAREKSPYDVHPGVAMVEKWISELRAKTGRSLEEWIRFIHAAGPKSPAERREWLEAKHHLGTNSAKWLAERARGGSREDSAEAYLAAAHQYVEQQYQGKKEALRPVYFALLELGKSLGDDVRACPCQTIVPLYRKHVFAQIKPTTNTRIDLGLALAHYRGKLPNELIDTGGLAKKDRITHRMEIASPDAIDARVRKWLKTAYDLDK